ncbi:MAG: paraquat-inducible protein A [bacterium]
MTPALPATAVHATPVLRRCHDCGLLQQIPALPLGSRAACPRCGGGLLAHKRDDVQQSLALYLTALLLWVVANSFDFLTFSLEGRAQPSRLISGAIDLWRDGLGELALLVFLFVILFPLGKILINLAVLLPLHFERRPRYLAPGLRIIETLRPWAMTEVFLLGVLVAYAKLLDLASLEIGPSLIAFVGLIVTVVAADASLHPGEIWERLSPSPNAALPPPAQREQLIGCHACHMVACVAPGASDAAASCPRCDAPLHRRKHNSLSRTWALMIAAAILYVPANLYPVMTVISFGSGSPSTILGGVWELIGSGMWPLALLVFFASITVPVLKLVGLTYLLISVQRGSGAQLRRRTTLYRIVEAVGRWSMIDIFMLSILVALVRLGAIATIEPGVGAIAFAGVVVLTMFAAMSFDPRLLWDAAGANHDR